MADARNNDRHSRLSAALRENLKRRKAQLRGRAGQSQPQASEGSEEDGTAPDVRKQDEPDRSA